MAVAKRRGVKSTHAQPKQFDRNLKRNLQLKFLGVFIMWAISTYLISYGIGKLENILIRVYSALLFILAIEWTLITLYLSRTREELLKLEKNKV